VLQHQVILFCLGETFTEQPPIYPPVDLPVNTRANAADFGGSVPKPGLEVNLGLCLPINLYASIMKCKAILVPLDLIKHNCLACYSCSRRCSLSNSL